MKRILITGANSYIGMSFENHLRQWPEAYQVDTIDMIDGSWREKSFAGYDAVFHVAGIVHTSSRKISKDCKSLYYRINTDLAIETAKKAKSDSVGQFIFMSSMSVYGDSAPIGKQKVITRDTPPAPANCYGDSKLQAENGILPLLGDAFQIAILRPPMIYGKGCKGNYPVLAKLVKKLPVFPYIQNQRSILYIGNLVEFVRLIIENEQQGIFWPQNHAYMNTSQMVQQIAAAHGRKVHLVKGFTGVLKALCFMTGSVKKAFGSLTYSMSMSNLSIPYCKYTNEETIRLTEE